MTILVCDRCGHEMREDDVDGDKLALTMKFHDPQTSSLLPLPRREKMELCPDCREDFAEWLGEEGALVGGLELNGSTPSEAAQTLTAQAGAPEDADEQG